MDGQLQTFDFIVLIVYMLGVFGLGCWFARKSGTTNEFMAAGRSLPGWAVGLSVFGTYVSSIGFLGNTGKAFSGNWNSWVFGLSLPIAAIFAVRYFVPLYRGEQNVSAYYQLEKRFGPWARLYAMASYLLSQLARIGTILYLVALALAPLTGWDIRTIIVVTGLLVTIYTLLGGIEAVIWTDVVQSFVLVGGAFLCAAILIWGDGGSQLMEVAKQNDKFSLGSFSLDPRTLVAPDPTFWMVLVYGIFINLTNFGIDQSFVQRYITAKSDKDAKFSVWLACLLFPVISALFFFIGTGLYSYAETHPDFLQQVQASVSEQLPGDMSAADKQDAVSVGAIGDKVLPQFIISKLPAGLAGLLIAAIFAAAMSSMDTSLNSSATLVLCDVYKRFWRPNAEERESMRVLYGSTFVFGFAGTLTALAMIQVRSALDAWWNLQGIFTGGMLGLFLLGLISKRARNPHAMVAVAIGLAVILWVSLSPTRLLNQTIPLANATVQESGGENVGNDSVSPTALFAATTSGDEIKFDELELRSIPKGIKILGEDGDELSVVDGVLTLPIAKAQGLSIKPKSLGSTVPMQLLLKSNGEVGVEQTIVTRTPSVLHKYMTNVVGTSTIVLLGVLLASFFGRKP